MIHHLSIIALFLITTIIIATMMMMPFINAHIKFNNNHHQPDPVSLENTHFWNQRKLQYVNNNNKKTTTSSTSSSSSRLGYRLVQLDFPSISLGGKGTCDTAVGDVFDISSDSHPTEVYQLLMESPSSSSSIKNNNNNNIINHQRHRFPPVSREDHGMMGMHATDDHHQFHFEFETKRDHFIHSDDSKSTELLQHEEEDEQNNHNIIKAGGSFLDPRLHVGEVRNEHGENIHDDDNDEKSEGSHNHNHNHKHELLCSQHEESYNLRIPRDVSKITVYCHPRNEHNNNNDKDRFISRTFNIDELIKHTPSFIPGKLRRPSPLRRTAKEQEASPASSGTEPRVFQLKLRGPPKTQFNIIILSGGFTAAQEKQFNDTVDRVLKFMDPTDPDVADSPELKSMHNTVPLARYYPFSNVFSVFEPSAESGASRPKYGITVNNNLNCYHPETIERAVTCNRKLAMALASVTPANPNERPDQSVVITVVNTPLYGGSAQYSKGQYHVGYFYQGMDGDNQDQYDQLKYASLFLHECGHAYLNLMDEYDIGLTSSSTVYFANCQAPSNGRAPSTSNNLQWKDWADTFANPSERTKYSVGVVEPSKYNVEQTSIPICGYSNYYKPNQNCMMQQLRDYYMCPVCRDAGTRTMLSLSQLSFGWPRFPVEDATLIIPEDAPSGDSSAITTSTGAVLHLPSFLGSSGKGFDITWEDHNGAEISDPSIINPVGCPVCLHLTSSYLGSVPKNTELKITAKINDNSNFVLPTYKNLPQYKHLFFQNTSFKFKIIPSGTAMPPESKQQPPLQTRSNFGYYAAVDANNYYTECLPQYDGHVPICNLTFEQTPYKAPEALGAALKEAEIWVYAVLGGCGLFFLLLWLCMSNKLSSIEEGRVRPIFESKFSSLVDCVYKIMSFSAIGFMVMTVATLAASGFFYSRISELGQIVIFPGIALSIGLYIQAFVGYWSLKMRSIRFIVINGVVLYMGFTVLFIITAVVINLGTELPDRKSFWNKNLKTFWEDLVADNPEQACGFQSMLTCSGFFISCTGVGANPTFCPANCDGPNNDYATPCQKRLTDWVADNYTIVVGVCFACLVLMAFALLFNLIFFYNIVRMKADIRKKLESQFESSHLGQFGTRSDPNAKDRALKFLQTLGEQDTDKLVTEFRRIDKDGNGELDPNELRAFFKKAFCFRVNMEQIKYLFSVADRDGSGTISVPEFLALFGSGERFAKSYNPDNLERSQRIEKVLSKSHTNFNALGGGGMPPPSKNSTASPKNGVLHVPSDNYSPKSGGNSAAPPPSSSSAPRKTPSAAFPSVGMRGAAPPSKQQQPAPKNRADLLGGGGGDSNNKPAPKQQQKPPAEPDLIDNLLAADDGEEMMLL